MKAHIYARVSTKEQADKGFSLEAQVSTCKAYCEAHGLDLGEATNVGSPGVFVDAGQSATKKKGLMDRPGGKSLLTAVQPGDCVVCVNPHRMFRNLRHSENQLYLWSQIGVVVHFVDMGIRTDTANGKLMLQILAAMAEWKAKIISERTREAHAWKKAGVVPPVPQKKRTNAPKNSLLAQAVINARQAPPPAPFSGVVRAYIRVSTKAQSADTQRRQIQTFIDNDPVFKDAAVVWYDDSGYSAYRKQFRKRPAGGRLYAEMQSGDALIVSRADRLFRSQQDLIATAAEIAARGSRLLLLDCNLRTDTPFGEMMFRMMGMIAEMESKDIGRAMVAGLHAKILKTQEVCDRLIPLLMKEAAPTKEIKGKISLKGLLTQEEWKGYCTLVWDLVQNGYGADNACRRNRKGAEGELGNGTNLFASVVRANQVYEQKLGWPAFPFRAGLGIRIRDVIRQTEELQQLHGFSQRRQDLLDFLKRYKITDTIKGSFMNPGHAPRALKRFYAIRKEMDRLQDDRLGMLVARGPANLETQLQLVAE
jgi:DNA invertase Pin-like site-specific DNA recombinase